MKIGVKVIRLGWHAKLAGHVQKTTKNYCLLDQNSTAKDAPKGTALSASVPVGLATR